MTNRPKSSPLRLTLPPGSLFCHACGDFFPEAEAAQIDPNVWWARLPYCTRCREGGGAALYATASILEGREAELTKTRRKLRELRLRIRSLEAHGNAPAVAA